MVTRRIVVAGAAVLALGLTWLPAGPARATAEDDARTQIQRLADGALGVLADKSLSKPGREEGLRKILLKNFNIPAIGKFVVGAHWRKAARDEKSEFLGVFETYVVKTYAVQLGQYAGEKFKILSVLPDKRGFVVISQVTPPNRPPVELKWRLRKPKRGELAVVDVVVENISMALTQRQEFSAVIQQRGGNLRGLISALREKIKDLDNKSTASN
jgi:phospholipid transport system substrate-binding protein